MASTNNQIEKRLKELESHVSIIDETIEKAKIRQMRAEKNIITADEKGKLALEDSIHECENIIKIKNEQKSLMIAEIKDIETLIHNQIIEEEKLYVKAPIEILTEISLVYTYSPLPSKSSLSSNDKSFYTKRLKPLENLKDKWMKRCEILENNQTQTTDVDTKTTIKKQLEDARKEYNRVVARIAQLKRLLNP